VHSHPIRSLFLNVTRRKFTIIFTIPQVLYSNSVPDPVHVLLKKSYRPAAFPVLSTLTHNSVTTTPISLEFWILYRTVCAWTWD